VAKYPSNHITKKQAVTHPYHLIKAPSPLPQAVFSELDWTRKNHPEKQTWPSMDSAWY